MTAHDVLPLADEALFAQLRRNEFVYKELVALTAVLTKHPPFCRRLLELCPLFPLEVFARFKERSGSDVVARFELAVLHDLVECLPRGVLENGGLTRQVPRAGPLPGGRKRLLRGAGLGAGPRNAARAAARGDGLAPLPGAAQRANVLQPESAFAVPDARLFDGGARGASVAAAGGAQAPGARTGGRHFAGGASGWTDQW